MLCIVYHELLLLSSSIRKVVLWSSIPEVHSRHLLTCIRLRVESRLGARTKRLGTLEHRGLGRQSGLQGDSFARTLPECTSRRRRGFGQSTKGFGDVEAVQEQRWIVVVSQRTWEMAECAQRRIGVHHGQM